MDRLLIIEPRNLIFKLELGKKCHATMQLKNVMHTMPVAFYVQSNASSKRYSIKPVHGIIEPLEAVSVVITLYPQMEIPVSIPYSDEKFVVKSVVVPGGSEYDPICLDWFTGNKKHVYSDYGARVFFVGGEILRKLLEVGCIEDVRKVLELDEMLVDSALDEHGSTAMHIAIRKGRPEIVQLLLELRASVNLANNLGQTALQAAANLGETLIVELLIARGANVNAKTRLGHTALQMAVAEGHLQVVKLLVENGADVNESKGDPGKTVLHTAVERARHPCLKLLLQMGANANGRIKDDGNTPLHLAILRADEKSMEMLLRHGACKDLKNRKGKTPRDLAREKGRRALVFLDALVFGDELRRASRKGNVVEVRESLRCASGEAGGHDADDHQWRALHIAAFKGHMGVVRVLLEAGADVESGDDAGYTALHCAVEGGNKDIVKLLLKYGADVNACTRNGSTAYDLATTFKYTGTASLLLEWGGRSGANKLHAGKGTGRTKSIMIDDGDELAGLGAGPAATSIIFTSTSPAILDEHDSEIKAASQSVTIINNMDGKLDGQNYSQELLGLCPVMKPSANTNDNNKKQKPNFNRRMFFAASTESRRITCKPVR